MGRLAYLLVPLLLMGLASTTWSAPEDDIRLAFARFVTAQNAHDLKVVEELLLDSPQFLWITRGTPIWGREAALTRFQSLYQGTWQLEPVIAELRIMTLSDSVAQLYVPIVFTIGPPGQVAQPTRFLMNQVLVKTPQGWKVSSILPILAPAQ